MECVQVPLCEMRWRAGTPSSMPQVVLSAEGCSEECTQLVCCHVEHQWHGCGQLSPMRRHVLLCQGVVAAAADVHTWASGQALGPVPPSPVACPDRAGLLIC